MEILFTDILTSNTKTTDCYVRCTLAIRKAFASKLASLLDCSLRFRQKRRIATCVALAQSYKHLESHDFLKKIASSRCLLRSQSVMSLQASLQDFWLTHFVLGILTAHYAVLAWCAIFFALKSAVEG